MAALRQEHTTALDALQAHAAAAEDRAMAIAEAKQLTKLGEVEPAVAALHARTIRQGDKIGQQNDVIRELAAEVERLSDVERELLEEVQRLSYADHALNVRPLPCMLPKCKVCSMWCGCMYACCWPQNAERERMYGLRCFHKPLSFISSTVIEDRKHSFSSMYVDL